jgi:hypothetical protein
LHSRTVNIRHVPKFIYIFLKKIVHKHIFPDSQESRSGGGMAKYRLDSEKEVTEHKPSTTGRGIFWKRKTKYQSSIIEPSPY